MKNYAKSFDKGKERWGSTEYKRLSNKRSRPNLSRIDMLENEIWKVEKEMMNTPYGLNINGHSKD